VEFKRLESKLYLSKFQHLALDLRQVLAEETSWDKQCKAVVRKISFGAEAGLKSQLCPSLPF